MPDKTKRDALAPPVRRVRSGIYSWVNSKKLPRGRTFQVVRRELSHLREDLVQAHGGETITPDAQILVDSVVEGLGVQKILGLYIRQYGVIDGQSIKQGRLELSPLLSRNWIGYSNVVRMGILALKEIDKGRQASSQADIEAILTSYSRVDEPEAAQGGQGDRQGKDGGEHDRVGKEAEIEAPASTSNEIQEPEEVK
jgi:hypothetical protein